MNFYHTLIFIAYCTALPAPNPQLQIPFFGGANNVTDTALQTQNFLAGFVNNIMASIFGMLRPNQQQQQQNQQPQQQQQHQQSTVS